MNLYHKVEVEGNEIEVVGSLKPSLPSLDIQVSGISYRLFLMPFLYVPLSVTCPLRSFST